MTRRKRQPPWAMLSFLVNLMRLIFTLICPWH